MELKQETICEDTLEIVREYYHLNIEPLFSVFSDDCVWMGPGNLLVTGAEAARGLFKDGFIMPAFHLEDPDFRLIGTGSPEQLIVLGQYSISSDEDAEVINASRQRGTFCYRLESGKWRLYHMHISNEWNELVGDEIFPVRISTQTYRYVKKLLAENKSRRPQAMVIRTGQANQFVDASTVVCIQALDRDCIFHMLNEKKQIPRAFKDLKDQLPDNFYQIHRSFFVNSDYVEKIERYSVTLITGETFPVPKMRYMQVREELTRMIEERGGK